MSQQSSLFVRQQGALHRTSNHNHGSSSCLPLSVRSNSLHCSNAKNNKMASLCLNVSLGSNLKLHPPLSGYENDAFKLYETITVDVEAPLDIWTVIKPGHVREKIAIFTSEEGRSDISTDHERFTTSNSATRDRMSAVCMNNVAMSGLLRAVKAKGSWEENGCAKRRRRSGNDHDFQQDQRSQVLDIQRHTHKLYPQCLDSTQWSGDGLCEGNEVMMAEEDEEQKVSVVEMVAFLEQRVNECQADSKPVLTLQRSSTTIMLSRAPPTKVRGQDPEVIKVSDMVAKLESDCLRRTEGNLSRNNSLRRSVGRVLLTSRDQVSIQGQFSSLSATSSSSSSVLAAQSSSRDPISHLETPKINTFASHTTLPPSCCLKKSQTPSSGELVLPQETRRDKSLETPTFSQAQKTYPVSEELELVPGLLFRSQPPISLEQLPQITDSAPPLTDLEPQPPFQRLTFDPYPPSLQPKPALAAPSDSGSQSESKRRKKADRALEKDIGILTSISVVVPVDRRASASKDFLEMRQRLQQLLEPQPYLVMLPHHLLVKVFQLLPTKSLAALKCTCHYFKFIIDTYDVRPADSLWVSDPRYREDPCKQCKKRYGRGDVSLCRWHHKPFCQAFPYGPGYWMCCHKDNRDAPGCNVGLHDNRWVLYCTASICRAT